MSLPIPDLSTSPKLAEFLKQHPPQSADFREFGRAILIHLRMKEKDAARLENKVNKLGIALKTLAEMLLGDAGAEAAPEAETAEAVPAGSTAATNATPTVPNPTPFPAGVPWKVEDTATAAPPAATAIPGADEEGSDEIDLNNLPKPDVVGRVVSAASIPPKPTGNGIKPSAS